jgi:hypothetical protein
VATFTPVKLTQAVLTTSDVTLYTVPGATSIILKEIILTNTTAASATVSISIVPSAGSAGVSNRIFEQVAVPAFTSVIIGDVAEVMPTGEFISAKSSAATTITIRASGVTIT